MYCRCWWHIRYYQLSLFGFPVRLWQARQTTQKLVGWCFEPSQPQRIITSGLKTNFNLSPSYSFHKSSYHKSCFVSLFIFRGHSTRGTCIQQSDLFYSVGLHRNQYWRQLTQEKLGRGFGKNAGKWTGRVEISKEEWVSLLVLQAQSARKKFLAVSVACMAIYWPTPGFKGRTFKLCVLTRWNFNSRVGIIMIIIIAC